MAHAHDEVLVQAAAFGQIFKVVAATITDMHPDHPSGRAADRLSRHLPHPALRRARPMRAARRGGRAQDNLGVRQAQDAAGVGQHGQRAMQQQALAAPIANRAQAAGGRMGRVIQLGGVFHHQHQRRLPRRLQRRLPMRRQQRRQARGRVVEQAIRAAQGGARPHLVGQGRLRLSRHPGADLHRAPSPALVTQVDVRPLLRRPFTRGSDHGSLRLHPSYAHYRTSRGNKSSG